MCLVSSRWTKKYALCHGQFHISLLIVPNIGHVNRRNPQMAEDVFEQAAHLVNFQMIRCGRKIDILSNSERLDSAFLGILRVL